MGPSLRYLGGQAVQLQRLRRALEGTEGITVDFLPVDPDFPGPLASIERVPFVRTVVRSVIYLTSLRRTLPACDIVHAYSASYWSFVLAPLPAMYMARRIGKRVLLNYHSGEAADHLERWRWLMRRALGLANRIVVPSRYLVEVFDRFGFRAEVAPNFVELDRINYRRREILRPRFLVNRNHEDLYRVGDVLSAFRLIQARHPEASLIVAGHGRLSGELQRQATELGLRNVRFTGPVRPDEMNALYAESDVFLNGSSIDNVPLSILEAFAAGIPVVSTDAGGIPYVVLDQHSGLLVPVARPDAMAAAACTLLDDSALAVAVGDNARAEVLEQFTVTAASGRWTSLYRDLGGADST